jgi:hypothetical protein
MKSTFEDGVWTHTFRQSSFNTLGLCLERGRRENLPGAVQVDTDAACVGTSVHAAIEAALLRRRAGGDDLGLAALVAIFEFNFFVWSEVPTFRWVKYTDSSARKFGELCLTHWYRDAYPLLDPLEIEWTFNKTIDETPTRIIKYSGTVDLIDRNAGLVDWKTSGRGPYVTWEKERWAEQPTVYTQAFAMEVAEHGFGQFWEPEDSVDFTYGVMHANGLQVFTVQRDRQSWDWQLAKAHSYCDLIEAGLEHWPLTDSSALCAPKWCTHWDTCRGMYVGDKPWKSA